MSKQHDDPFPDVSTEPQRLALDEMSHQLVAKLNAMVHEQNERAERFAATQHSLSALPNQQLEVPAIPKLELPELAIPEVVEQVPAHSPAPAFTPTPAQGTTFTPVADNGYEEPPSFGYEEPAAPAQPSAPEPPPLPLARKKGVAIPPRPTQRREATDPTIVPPPVHRPWGSTPFSRKKSPSSDDKKEEGIGSGTIITIIVIVLIVLRACS